MQKNSEEKFMKVAIDLAFEGMHENKGGPFGAVIVQNGVIVGRGNNQVTSTNDPTAHAEIVAIRDACKQLNTFELNECVIYTTCEPCPMCLAAIYWTHINKIFYGSTKHDAANINFDDSFIYDEIMKNNAERKLNMEQISRDQTIELFNEWQNKTDKISY